MYFKKMQLSHCFESLNMMLATMDDFRTYRLQEQDYFKLVDTESSKYLAM